ncbi:homoserine kinase [Winogradskyella epiphytica]|uniref:Homoserine kinase n=1 Tax=Winogradskyella epiphytica TaxID=262005 RepID=A0A2V4X868_9FLAO|nr:homoserine kinase [Winogradskyella epiphytica]PYE81789.1 homoserine kinase [Winogradskyella epiphytica]GGW62646.1 homoserine kinase [Winogradskyella epiphytica]
MKNEIKIFSPATVANVACGFDVLGFCLDSIGDEMIIRKTEAQGLKITKVEGYDLPYEIEQNVAGVSAHAMYTALEPDCGFEIEIYKKIKPGSGIGSSAASAAGSVWGMNELLGNPLNQTQLTYYAMKGEALASQCEHADNLAPAIFGGFTLVKSIDPLHILQLPTPSELYATLIHPQIEVKTSESRAILPKEIPLQNAISQWANVGSLVHALHTADYDLIKESLIDSVVESHRKELIPHFDAVKTAALNAGALGCAISGAGPSIFALSKGKKTATAVESAMRIVYSNTEIEFETYVSKINVEGIYKI